MVKRTQGARMGTRKKLRKNVRSKGKLKIRSYLQKFEVGDTVQVKVDSSHHKGMPYKRFFGKQGKIVEKRGKSYLIAIKEGGKTKSVLCSPVHLKKK